MMAGWLAAATATLLPLAGWPAGWLCGCVAGRRARSRIDGAAESDVALRLSSAHRM